MVLHIKIVIPPDIDHQSHICNYFSECSIRMLYNLVLNSSTIDDSFVQVISLFCFLLVFVKLGLLKKWAEFIFVSNKEIFDMPNVLSCLVRNVKISHTI